MEPEASVGTSSVTIVITNLNDDRIIRLIESLKLFNFKEMIVADGGSDSTLISKIMQCGEERLRVISLPGSVAETRSKLYHHIRGKITVFIDTDEVPPHEWLNSVTEPITSGECDFVFGPTKPMFQPKNRVQRYLSNYDEWFYSKVVSEDVSKGPMGNSAWKTDILKKVHFDPFLSMGGEDYDFNLKAISAGYIGKFNQNAFVYHDYSRMKSFGKLFKKRFGYMVGAAIAYRKNRVRIKELVWWKGEVERLDDLLQVFFLLLKPLAFIASLIVG